MPLVVRQEQKSPRQREKVVQDSVALTYDFTQVANNRLPMVGFITQIRSTNIASPYDFIRLLLKNVHRTTPENNTYDNPCDGIYGRAHIYTYIYIYTHTYAYTHECVYIICIYIY